MNIPPSSSPLCWGNVQVTTLSEQEDREQRDLILDPEGIAAWQHIPSFVERYRSVRTPHPTEEEAK